MKIFPNFFKHKVHNIVFKHKIVVFNKTKYWLLLKALSNMYFSQPTQNTFRTLYTIIALKSTILYFSSCFPNVFLFFNHYFGTQSLNLAGSWISLSSMRQISGWKMTGAFCRARGAHVTKVSVFESQVSSGVTCVTRVLPGFVSCSFVQSFHVQSVCSRIWALVPLRQP